mgnify:CR=1 FL=1
MGPVVDSWRPKEAATNSDSSTISSTSCANSDSPTSWANSDSSANSATDFESQVQTDSNAIRMNWGLLEEEAKNMPGNHLLNLAVSAAVSSESVEGAQTILSLKVCQRNLSP